MPIARLAPLLVACALLAPARAAAAAPHEEADPAAAPESSRWVSFTRLVSSRWSVRVESVLDAEDRARLFRRCVQDAWYLALPGLLADGAPCARLVAPDRAARRRTRTSARDAWRRRLGPAATAAPGPADFFACTADAEKRRDSGMLSVCGVALRSRAQLVASLDDPERFGGWFSECKRVMLGPPAAPPGEGPAVATKPGPLDELHARHCFRILPTLYEVQWLGKVSDYWTTDEQRRLYERSRELGEL